jgi:hypothetical protein
LEAAKGRGIAGIRREYANNVLTQGPKDATNFSSRFYAVRESYQRHFYEKAGWYERDDIGFFMYDLPDGE